MYYAAHSMGTHYLDEDSSTIMNPKKETSHKIFETGRPVVLHGKVQYTGESSSSGDVDRLYKTQTIRQRMQRHSEFSKLQNEMELYEKMITELSDLLEEKKKEEEVASAAWRAKILIGSAHKMDQELREQIPLYEKTLRNTDGDEELRSAQTACMKLHRDFQRLHKQLVMATSLHKRQRQVSRLGAVGWTSKDKDQSAVEGKEYTDHRMNNDVPSVEKGRYPIDIMDEEMQNANRKGNDTKAARESQNETESSPSCYLDSLQMLCGTVACGSEMYKPTDAAYQSADIVAEENVVAEAEKEIPASDASVIATDGGVIAVDEEQIDSFLPRQDDDVKDEQKGESSEPDCLEVYILGYLLD